MHRLNALLLTLLAILVMGCGSVATSPTVPSSSLPTQQSEAETPTAVPTVYTDAAVVSPPPPSPTPTRNPTPTLVPTLEATPTPTSGPPTPTAAPTPQIKVPIGPTATPSPNRSGGGGGGFNLDPTPENRPLILLYESNPALAKTLLEVHWVQDGISSEESAVLSRFRLLASENASLAEQIVGMPFIAESAEAGDRSTLYALYDLSVSYPKNLRLLREQDWFTDGLTQNEAHYVTILRRHARLRALKIFGADDDQILIKKALGEKALARTISLPEGRDIELVAFNRPLGSLGADRVLDHLEAAVAAIEDFMTVPFPEEQILLLFTDPGENFSGLYLGTHLVVSPDLGVKDINRLVTGLLARYYWCCTDNEDWPLWISEGGSAFLATYVADKFDVESLDERKRDLLGRYGRVGYCKSSLGISSIQKLLTKLEETGIEKHRESSFLHCNSGYGEVLALDLYQFMGDEPFRDAWKEIYRLSEESDVLLPEETIYQTFLSRVPENKVKEFNEIYQRWHGGEFE